MKRKKILLLITPLFLMSNTTNISSTPFIEATNVKEDLKDSGLIKEYKDITFLDFYEYKYGSNDYSLYFYVFIPTNYNYVSISDINKIQISFNESSYYKYSFNLLNNEDEYYKFKINLNNKDDVLSSLNESKREYKVSGIELYTKESSYNANEYKVGGIYSYSGYSKGINGNNESTLSREVTSLDTIDLNVKELTYREVIDDPFSSSLIKNYNQINSVYFNVPNYYLNEYGSLKEINFEYYKYRTAPIFIVNSDLYKELKDYIGIKQSKENNIGYDLSTPYTSSGSNLILNLYGDIYSYNNEFNSVNTVFKIDNTNSLVYLFDGGNNGDDDISSDILKEYIYNYNSSYFTGKNYKDLSNDLFILDKSDGYKNYSINDKDNLLIENNTTINKFASLFGLKTSSKEYKCIEKIDNSSINQKELFIEDEEFDDFKNDCIKASENDESTYIFRFDSSIYNVGEIYKHTYGDLFYGNIDGYVVQENIYLDFDIISLTFGKEGNSYIIPAISNPIDIVSPIITPDIPESWLDKIKQILKYIIGALVILASLLGLNFIFNLLGISIKDIINFLFIKPFKWIKKKLNKNKGKNNGKKK